MPTEAGEEDELPPMPEVSDPSTVQMEMPKELSVDRPTEDSETQQRAVLDLSSSSLSIPRSPQAAASGSGGATGSRGSPSVVPPAAPSPDPLSGPIDELPGPPVVHRGLAPGEAPPEIEELASGRAPKASKAPPASKGPEDSRELAPLLASTPARGQPVVSALSRASADAATAVGLDLSNEATQAFDPSQFVPAPDRETHRFEAVQLQHVDIPAGRPTELGSVDTERGARRSRSKDAEMAIQSSLAGLAVVILVVILVGSFLFFYQMNQPV